MAERRSIYKKISHSEQVANLPVVAQLLYTWMIPHADDFGLLPYSPRTLKAMIIPMVDIRVEDIGFQMEDIGKQGLIEEFEFAGEKFWKLKKFREHQTLKRDRIPNILFKIPNEIPKNPKAYWEFLENLESGVDSKWVPSGIHLDTEGKGREEKRISPVLNRTEEGSPLFLDEYIKQKRKSPHLADKILAEFADEKRPAFTIKIQWDRFTSRNIKAAKKLEIYSWEQIQEAFRLMQIDRNKDKKYLKKWGLETLEKYMEEIKQK